jgi:programmed cell death protein 4
MHDADGDAAGSLDKNDPNYDSADEQKNAVSYHMQKSLQIKAFKKAVMALIDEYFNSGDINEAATSLQELDEPEFHHFFIKKLVTMAMDKHSREREMASNLLSSLYSEVIPGEQLQKGFLNLAQSLDDLKLDVPDACEILALFLARAVVDDILPPAFIQKLPASENTPQAECKNKCELHMSARHAAERMLRCWGGNVGMQLEDTKQSVASMLKEYQTSGDVAEVRACLHKLALPFFHHEVVKQALLLALEDPNKQPLVLRLLKELSSSSDISSSQLLKGFTRVRDHLDDTALDCPKAHTTFSAIVEAATKQGWLDKSFSAAARVPSPVAVGKGGTAASIHSVQAFKTAAVTAIQEYFDSADAAEVARSLEDLDEPGFMNIAVKQAIQLAMDRKDRERELVSVLLATLPQGVVSQDQMAMGFTRLLASVEDLTLDNPDAAHLLSLFLGRAIVDEALPPSFLTSVLPSLRNDSLGVAVVQSTGAMLGARHAAERLINCWHGGGRTVEQLRASMQDLLQEYLTNGDTSEAAHCLMDLAVPFYHHELVKRALIMAADDWEGKHNQPLLLKLLTTLSQSGEINQDQMSKGFERIEESLEDLSLDNPKARDAFKTIKQQALTQGWLTANA